jgi:hypothetical protein
MLDRLAWARERFAAGHMSKLSQLAEKDTPPINGHQKDLRHDQLPPNHVETRPSDELFNARAIVSFSTYRIAGLETVMA